MGINRVESAAIEVLKPYANFFQIEKDGRTYKSLRIDLPKNMQNRSKDEIQQALSAVMPPKSVIVTDVMGNDNFVMADFENAYNPSVILMFKIMAQNGISFPGSSQFLDRGKSA